LAKAQVRRKEVGANFDIALDEESKKGAKTTYSRVDQPFVALTFLLLGTGLITMFSASYSDAYFNLGGNATYYIVRQGSFAALGVIAMFIISRIDYHRFRIFALPSLVISILLLAAVPFIGETRNDATRWLSLGPLGTFQPSEIAKFAVILSFSVMATGYGPKMKKLKYGIIPFFAVMGLMAGLLYLEPHLSATVIIAVTGVIIIFAGGASFFHLMLIGIAGICGGAGFIMTKPYAMDRIRVWLDPFIDPLDKGWQGVQSLLAIGSGGIWGLGLGQSRQKNLYLPEPANDFIFSVICEELGFIGAMLIVIAFGALIVRGYWVAIHAKDRFGCLLVTGITSQIAIQTIFNMCVVSGLMPITGASLPFFSYGGTSLFIQLVEVGVLLSVSRQITAPKQG